MIKDNHIRVCMWILGVGQAYQETETRLSPFTSSSEKKLSRHLHLCQRNKYSLKIILGRIHVNGLLASCVQVQDIHTLRER